MERNPLIVKYIDLTIDEPYHGDSSENTFLPLRPDSETLISSFSSPPGIPIELTWKLDPFTPATSELFATNTQINSDDGDDGDPEEDDDSDADDEDEFDGDEDVSGEDGDSREDSEDRDEFEKDDEDEDEKLAGNGTGTDEEDDLEGGDNIDQGENDANLGDHEEDEEFDDEDDDDEDDYGSDWDVDEDDDEFDDDEDELKSINSLNTLGIKLFSPSPVHAIKLVPISRTAPDQAWSMSSSTSAKFELNAFKFKGVLPRSRDSSMER